mgnify:CR=1 FL=1
MRRTNLSLIGGAIAFAITIPTQAWAQPIPVDHELVLGVDVSNSVNSSRYETQKDGYAAAFRNPQVHDAITGGALGSIAVTYMEWSSMSQQTPQVGWTQISSPTEANSFADAIDAASRSSSGFTGISQAIDWSVDAIQSNDFVAQERQIIDISGDGTDNTPGNPADARDEAIDEGMIINGLAIEENTGTSLTDYYRNNVIGAPAGSDSAVFTAETFEDFENAVVEKISTEVNNVPLPGTAPILGLGLATLAAGPLRRRRAST